jgi:chemotaxis regulatin CheY-phosphate phosphatase CheZ
METGTILQTILDQSLLAGILGFFLWKIWDAFVKEKDKKDTLAEALIKLTQTYEDRYLKELMDEKDVKEFMREIREFIRTIQDAK